MIEKEHNRSLWDITLQTLGFCFGVVFLSLSGCGSCLGSFDRLHDGDYVVLLAFNIAAAVILTLPIAAIRISGELSRRRRNNQ
ncbi:MAG: hypothetical protein ACI8RZ_002918 [Myxococcota bacterium]|jgi:hypothetical protein